MIPRPPLERDFLGAIVKRRSVPDIRLTETILPPHSCTPKHFHDRNLLGWCLRGSYTNVYTRETQEIQNSRIMFCPAGELHTTLSEPGSLSFALELDQGWLERFGEVSLPKAPTVFELGSMTALMTRVHHEFNETDAPSALAIEGMVLEIIAVAMRFRVRPTIRAPRWLTEVTGILDETFRDRLTIAGIAEQVQIHPVYLAATFRRRYGHSIVDYVRELRVRFASRQLSDSEDSLATIAQAAGFSDQSHFTRSFKRITGMTPAVYRAYARKS